MLTVELIRLADLTARKGFTYQSEGTKPEDDIWRSFADDALNERRWSGDCDDLASTSLDILCRLLAGKGIDLPLDGMFRLQVQTQDCPPTVPFDHMVAGVMLGHELWIIGDTYGHAYPYKRSPHRIVRWSRLSEGVRWYQGGSPQ